MLITEWQTRQSHQRRRQRRFCRQACQKVLCFPTIRALMMNYTENAAIYSRCALKAQKLWFKKDSATIFKWVTESLHIVALHLRRLVCLQVSHTVSISKALTGYRFGATYVGDKHLGPGESFPVLLGDMDPSGNTSATLIHQYGNNWRVKMQSQVQVYPINTKAHAWW